MMQYYVSEAKNPPWGISPYTIKGVIAILLEKLQPHEDVVIGSIITLKGNRVTPRDIRSAITAATPRGQLFATRTIKGEQMKVWRLK